MKTLLLDNTLWDLCLDSSGGIAVAEEPYAIAQDVASACKTFLGECWYNTALGVPYYQQILGHEPPLSFIKSQLAAAALQVPGCNEPVVFFTGFVNRALTGQIQFVDDTGATVTTQFSGGSLPFILGESDLGGMDEI